MKTTKNCPMEIAAEALRHKIEAQELPNEPIDWGDWSYNQIVAHVRHEYTNYERLLEKLPDCPIEFECESFDAFGDGICLHREIAHETLKWEAKSKAEIVYARWLERQRK